MGNMQKCENVSHTRTRGSKVYLTFFSFFGKKGKKIFDISDDVTRSSLMTVKAAFPTNLAAFCDLIFLFRRGYLTLVFLTNRQKERRCQSGHYPG